MISLTYLCEFEVLSYGELRYAFKGHMNVAIWFLGYVGSL